MKNKMIVIYRVCTEIKLDNRVSESIIIVIIIKTKVLLPQAGDICRFWLFSLGPFVSMLRKTDIIWFSNLSTRTYLMKVIPETCRAH